MNAERAPQATHQLSLRDAITEAGGKYVLLALQDEEAVFTSLWAAQDRLQAKMQHQYTSIDKVPYTIVEGFTRGLFA